MLVIASPVQFAEAVIWYVDDDATGSSDGTSWTDAFTELTDALDMAVFGDEIWVAEGVYKPGTARTDTFSFTLMTNSGVEVYGGFRGLPGDEIIHNETTRPFHPETGLPILQSIMSGDLGASGRSYHIVTMNSVEENTLLDGFIIRDGFASTSGNSTGAGLRITGAESSPQIHNCVFENNVAFADLEFFVLGEGGAVSSINNQGSPVFSNCHFINNQAALLGGAVRIHSTLESTFISCTFSGNSTTAISIPGSPVGLGSGGGAIYVSGAADQLVTLIDCDFSGNLTTEGDGGALFHAGTRLEARRCSFTGNVANSGSFVPGQGGAIFATLPRETKLVQCRYIENEGSSHGGGIAFDRLNDSAHTIGPVYIVNCQFIGNTASPNGLGGGLFHDLVKEDFQVINSLFSGNSAQSGGAILSNQENNETRPTVVFTNCTIADNEATGGTQNAGGIHVFGKPVDVRNSILWGNTASGQGGSTSMQIGPDTLSTVTYSCVEGGYGDPEDMNIDDDPLFQDPPSVPALQRNYQLLPCSPATDAANIDALPEDFADMDENGNVMEAIPWDLRRSDRVVDNPYRTPTGVGDPDVPDMGAYELYLEECAPLGDMDGNSVVDGRDIALFVACLLEDALLGCQCADVNLSGAVSFEDLPCFIHVLLTGTNCEEAAACLSGERFFVDCNNNGVHDAYDIFYGSSTDCNGNGIPDECEIDEASTAPGGPYYCQQDCAQDVNDNGIPDECEPDCNKNGIPDDWDIATATSADVNENGIPDECETDCNNNGVPDDYDILIGTSADCNASGIPDECEPDCNANGVPDDCDIDPSDPDGDGWVSPDCNNNGLPDECDLSLPPPFGSFDCNENGIPDECDIASGYSEDENENGIPDECEGESLMMGGEGGGEGGGESAMMTGDDDTGETPVPHEFDEASAWEAYYDWARGQCWGSSCETTGGEQFQRAIAKKRELGLPMDRSW